MWIVRVFSNGFECFFRALVNGRQGHSFRPKDLSRVWHRDGADGFRMQASAPGLNIKCIFLCPSI